LLVGDYCLTFRRYRSCSSIELVEETMVHENGSKQESKARPWSTMKGLLSACFVAFLTVFIRCVYRYALAPLDSDVSIYLRYRLTNTNRTVELSSGWNSALALNEVTFSVLDGM